jgi:hypothetical protein
MRRRSGNLMAPVFLLGVEGKYDKLYANYVFARDS